jgi:hypothetical protein
MRVRHRQNRPRPRQRHARLGEQIVSRQFRVLAFIRTFAPQTIGGSTCYEWLHAMYDNSVVWAIHEPN